MSARLDNPRPTCGQVWRERDRRGNRNVIIVEFCNTKYFKVIIYCIETGRTTSASVSRFNGKAHGYEYVREATAGEWSRV